MFTNGNALIVYQLLSTTCRDISLENEYEETFAVNQLFSLPPQGWRAFISNTFEGGGGGGGLIETGDLFEGGGGVFYLAKMMVSVLHKEPKYKVEKLKYKKSIIY